MILLPPVTNFTIAIPRLCLERVLAPSDDLLTFWTTQPPNRPSTAPGQPIDCWFYTLSTSKNQVEK
jgi:hypothetical protein